MTHDCTDGKAFRITGPFSVTISPLNTLDSSLHASQENILFIYDTKALHHVIIKVSSLARFCISTFGAHCIKDGNMYEPTADFSQYVYTLLVPFRAL